MTDAIRSRARAILSIGAIVVALAMLVVGFVAAGSSGGADVVSATGADDAPSHDAVERDGVVTGGSTITVPTTVHAHEDATQPPTELALVDIGTAAVIHAHDETATTVPPSAAVPAPTPTGEHDHAVETTVPAAPPTSSTTTVPAGPIISVDDPRLTPEQRAAAIDLIERTTEAMRAFPDEAAVQAAGYRSIGDAATGFEHYVNWSFLTDPHEVDPAHIESIVLRVQNGVKTVESAMYILSLGKGMDDVPDIAGDLTTWHDHTNLCFSGTTVVGVAGPDGTCEHGTLVVTPPMLHVWITEQPCGPFAGIESSGHGVCHTH